MDVTSNTIKMTTYTKKQILNEIENDTVRGREFLEMELEYYESLFE